MGEMVIACYRPKPGKEAELLELERVHVPAPRAQHASAVQEPWERFATVSDIGTLAALPGATEPFPHFEPLGL